jgi:hypothetical protein
MDATDLKLLLLNASTMAISFSALEATLKITLLIASIGYTIQRWYLMNKKEYSIFKKRGQNFKDGAL